MAKTVLIILTVAAAAAPGYAGMGEVLASWPSPKYPNTIVVNGIAFEGEYIWIKSIDAEDNAVLQCTKSGSLINEISFPYHGWVESYGLAFDGTYLWTIYPQPIGTIRYDRYVKYTTTGSFVGDFATHDLFYYDSSISVSWDGQYLWTDGRPKNQTNPNAEKLTTASSTVATFPMPPYWETAAGYYNRQLWAGGPNNYVYGMRIGGGVVASFPAPGGSCYAVGFDGEYVWTADRNRPQYIYKVDIDVVDVAPASFGKVKATFR